VVPGMGQFGGLCCCGGGGVWRCGGLDKVGTKFSSVKLIGQVMCGGADRLEGGERLRLHIPVSTRLSSITTGTCNLNPSPPSNLSDPPHTT